MNYPYPKISIITPSLDQGRFIERCILSVIKQGYPNLEYIIIDGGSTDGSVDIIKKYERHLAHWVSSPDRGQVNAINNGLSKATGDIAAWLNCDDFYYPAVFEKIANEFMKNPVIHMFYGDAILLNHDGEALSKQTPAGINLRLLSIDCYIAQPSTFIRKPLLEKIGFLDESIPNGFDYDFFIKIFKNFKTKYLPLLISGVNISCDTLTYRNWEQTIKEKMVVQAKHYSCPSAKAYIESAAYSCSKYKPHFGNKTISLDHYLKGVLRYIRCNMRSPFILLKQFIAISNLIYLRLVKRVWTWHKI